MARLLHPAASAIWKVVSSPLSNMSWMRSRVDRARRGLKSQYPCYHTVTYSRIQTRIIFVPTVSRSGLAPFEVRVAELI